MTRVVTHAGFSSSGNLTDALNHPGFVEMTNSLENGLILEQLAAFEDPTGVLGGAQQIILSSMDSLKYTYGSKSLESLMSESFGKQSSVMRKLSNSARFDTTRKGARVDITARALQGAGVAAQHTTSSSFSNEPSSDPAHRTFITGPRKMVREVKSGSGTVLHYQSHLVADLAVVDGTTPKIATARFAIVGASHALNGQPFFTDIGGNANRYGRASTPLVSAPQDSEIAGLFSLPSTCVARLPAAVVPNVAHGPSWFGEQPNAGKVLGFDSNSILIPLSGIEDMTVGANTIGGISGRIDVNSNGINTPTDTLNLHTGAEGDDGFDSEIELDMLVQLATMAGLGGNKFDVAVFDVAMLMEYDMSTNIAAGAQAATYTFNVSAHVESNALRRSALSIIQSDSVDVNVLALRGEYEDCEQIKRVKAYRDWCIAQGRTDSAGTMFRQMLSEQVRKNLGILGHEFRSAGGAPVTLLAPVTVANFASGLEASKLIDTTTLDVFIRPENPTVWIGPNAVPVTMRMINPVVKVGLMERWLRIVDYVVLESLMDMEFSRSQN